uniref:Protein yippee-like n=1 Tax=Sus scrofa TaxID=9823 RepID=A0A8W4FP42_PIG
MVKMTRSKTFQAYLPSCHRTYSCIHCRAHLANHDELISKWKFPGEGSHRSCSCWLIPPSLPHQIPDPLSKARDPTASSWIQSFQGSQGRAYLFNSVVNVGCGPAEERVLLTGLHAVADIYCENCKTTLGWKYEHAFESSQKYKEGKYIIELAHMIKDNGWD